MIKSTYKEVDYGKLFKFIGDRPQLSYIRLEADRLIAIDNSCMSYEEVYDEEFYESEVVVYDDFNLAERVQEYVGNMSDLAKKYIKDSM